MSINQEGKLLQDFTNDTYVVNTDDNTNLSFDKSPVYVVKFGEYAGLLNTDYVPDLVRHLRTRDDIQYIVLNMDYTVKK